MVIIHKTKETWTMTDLMDVHKLEASMANAAALQVIPTISLYFQGVGSTADLVNSIEGIKQKFLNEAKEAMIGLEEETNEIWEHA